ncbi:MAG: hypothetical protein IIX71_08885 [Ruminococcus sp.]|nr:hypothetical protein [Ruminococcus sp.]MBQ1309095.1 hypothetical protein [Ruminococcus sp.]MBQ1310189.1 hypothetical protein [Ruminococcus sp.]
MAREKDGFREQLERLDEKFPEQETLKYNDIGQLLGYSQSTAKRKWKPFYNPKCGGVSKVRIAQELCAVGKS